MKDLNFNPYKTKDEFRQNYKLHDLAETYGKNLLIQWGFGFTEFGKDNRHQKVWEDGEDQPDLIIEYNGKKALVDWKGKHHPIWLSNKRAILSYESWKSKLNLPVLICFALFNNHEAFLDFKFACLGVHSYTSSNQKEWDKNTTVEFEKDLPEFTKANVLKYLI
ncbi:MAG: hypothetical protein M1480_19470 [Bacteroidetes bacterium]|nr:hypothetical protein [Bacteroidota bacterium]